MKKSLLISALCLLGCPTQFNPANCVVAPGCAAGEFCDPVTETCQPVPGLSLTSVEPRYGSQSASTQIKLRGTGFQNGITVRIGGSLATNVTVTSSTELTALTPTSQTYCGPVNVHLANPDNTAVDRADLFRYISTAPPKFVSQQATVNVQLPGSPDQLIVMDLDGDTQDEVALKSANGNNIVLCTVSRGFASTCSLSVPYSATVPSFMRIYDFEHNSRPDILIASHATTGGASALLLSNSGTLNGNWQMSPYPLYAGISDLVPVERDTANGPVTDLFVATADKLVSLPFNLGTMPPSTLLASEVLRSFQVVQLNAATAAPEIVAVRASGGLVVLEQSGTSTYSPKWSNSQPATYFRLTDITADGKPDLIADNSGGTTFYFARGQGNGTFTTPTTFNMSGLTSNAFEPADLACDGSVGLVVATAKSVSYMKGDSEGAFAAPTPIITAPSDITALAVKDLNGDGRPDLFYATANALFVAQNLAGP